MAGRVFLKRKGYRILQEQAALDGCFLVDKKAYKFQVRADFLVSKKGKKAVVEVKTGKKSINPAYPDTRRQLLEYAALYEADEIFIFSCYLKKYYIEICRINFLYFRYYLLRIQN